MSVQSENCPVPQKSHQQIQGAWGAPGPTNLFKVMQFSGNFGLRGQNSAGPPLAKILDPPLKPTFSAGLTAVGPNGEVVELPAVEELNLTNVTIKPDVSTLHPVVASKNRYQCTQLLF